MKAKLVLVGLIWLVPVACWFGAPPADRAFTTGAGSVVAALLTVFIARQPMLGCGVCGAATPYFDNYTQTIARLHGNWRRYFACHSCGKIIDRLTGLPVVGVPDTPVFVAASRSDVRSGVSGCGGLLVFGAVVIGALVFAGISRDVVHPDRAETVLLWCLAIAIIGILLIFAGRFLSKR